MITKIKTAVWDFLVAWGEFRAARVLKNSNGMWY